MNGLPVTFLGDLRAPALKLGSVNGLCQEVIIALTDLHCQTK